MTENTQHWHRCPAEGCTESWICKRVNCGVDLCDACEQREERERQQFEDYHAARGFQPTPATFPEVAEALVRAHKEKS